MKLDLNAPLYDAVTGREVKITAAPPIERYEVTYESGIMSLMTPEQMERRLVNDPPVHSFDMTVRRLRVVTRQRPGLRPTILFYGGGPLEFPEVLRLRNNLDRWIADMMRVERHEETMENQGPVDAAPRAWPFL